MIAVRMPWHRSPLAVMSLLAAGFLINTGPAHAEPCPAPRAIGIGGTGDWAMSTRLSYEDQASLLFGMSGLPAMGMDAEGSDRAGLRPHPSQGASAPKARRWSVIGTVGPVLAGGVGLLGTDHEDFRSNAIKARIAVPVGLMGAGIVIGPALGYYHAGLHGRGTRGLLIRLAAVGVTAALYDAGPSENNNYGGVGLLVMGGLVAIGSAAYDIARLGPLIAESDPGGRSALSPGP